MRKWIKTGLALLTWAYFAFLLGWLTLRVGVGDRWFPVFALNSLAWFFFLPLSLVLGVAWLTKRRTVWLGFALTVALWLSLYGELFLPPVVRSPQAAEGPTLTVMTYNVLTINQHPAGVIASIRASDADVVALQELSPVMEQAIEPELAEAYPYRILAPNDNFAGMGLLSRYPLTSIQEDSPGMLFAEPQIATLDFAGTPITIFHFHAALPFPRLVAGTGLSVTEWEAQTVVSYAEAHPGPFIAFADLNATDQSDGYHLLTGTLNDAWREAGWGPGHTFPGASQDGYGSPLNILGIRIPSWLARIDFIFVSDEWQTLSAEIGSWDGASDHRPVVVTLQLADVAP